MPDAGSFQIKCKFYTAKWKATHILGELQVMLPRSWDNSTKNVFNHQPKHWEITST
jgi:hypothetical protein